jgi:hypothetical protein
VGWVNWKDWGCRGVWDCSENISLIVLFFVFFNDFICVVLLRTYLNQFVNTFKYRVPREFLYSKNYDFVLIPLPSRYHFQVIVTHGDTPTRS